MARQVKFNRMKLGSFTTPNPDYPTGITGEPYPEAYYVYDDRGNLLGKCWKNPLFGGNLAWNWSYHELVAGHLWAVVVGGAETSKDKCREAILQADRDFRVGKLKGRPEMTLELPAVEHPDAR
jgi:hypothetical protein